ncbi:MAG: cation transporter [Myxococcota bacterium]
MSSVVVRPAAAPRWGRRRLLWSLVAMAGCASAKGPPKAPDGAAEVVLSMQGIDCQSCGQTAVEALTATPGVYVASFERDAVELHVAYDAAQVDPPQLLAVVHGLGYRAIRGPGQGAYTSEVVFAPGLDVQQISTDGELVDLEAFLVPGKVTVFDYHAVWCGPCKEVDRHMLALLERNDDIALRKLDVVDWSSALATKHLGKVATLPYLIVHGRSGKPIAQIAGLDLVALDRAIERGRRR